MITAVLAFLADTLIGDPRSKLHPVVLIGSLIASLERSLYHEGDTDRRKLWAGGLLAVTVLILVYNMTACLLQLVSLLGNQYVTVLAEAALPFRPEAWQRLAGRFTVIWKRAIWKMPGTR